MDSHGMFDPHFVKATTGLAEHLTGPPGQNQSQLHNTLQQTKCMCIHRYDMPVYKYT